MTTPHILKYAEEPALDDLFVVKSFHQWMNETRSLPVPKALFGPLWLEGEIAVMSGDPGVGKSLLAVQIAESIAGGRKFEPFAMTAKPQSVLYLNLKLSPEQFIMRYAGENDADDGSTREEPYKFANRLYRVDINIHKKLPDGYRTFDEVLPVLVERLVKKTKAKVVIIDNITYLQRSVYGYGETYTIMKALHRLRSELGISILVLARNSKYGSDRASSAGSCSALFSRFADSVFTIGKSRVDPSVRFVKQLIVHSSEMIYDASHVASFAIRRLKGSFLGFEHTGFCPESEHRHPVTYDRLWPAIDNVKTLSDKGKSIREIAAKLDLSKSSVQRYLQIWTPEIREAVKPEPASPTPSTAKAAGKQLPESFPGEREYDEAMEDARFDVLYYDEEADENSYEYRLLDRESWLIEAAAARAKEIYDETGVAPKLADDPDYAEFKRIVADGGDPFANDREYPEAEPPSGGSIGPSSGQASLTALHRGKPPSEPDDAADPVTKARRSCKGSQAAWRRAALSGENVPGLKYEINDHGRETWVEKRDKRRRKPIVWYTFNSNGRKQRHVRDSWGVTIKTESGPLIE